jgi:hypothetical protein
VASGSLDLRMRVAAENHARSIIDGALNARRDLGGRGRRRGITRRSQSGCYGNVQCSKEHDPDEKTQQIHAFFIGNLRYGL